jgi:hypothetical protein
MMSVLQLALVNADAAELQFVGLYISETHFLEVSGRSTRNGTHDEDGVLVLPWWRPPYDSWSWQPISSMFPSAKSSQLT